jgi:peptidoglycan/LPS O-acetylase OafA/YrhL
VSILSLLLNGEIVGSIRLFLAMAVMISHADVGDINIVPGHVAVQAFFIISGFYMALILNQKYSEHSVFVYYSNRFLRLFPTYLIVLSMSFLALWVSDIGIFTRIDKFKDIFTHSMFVTVSYLWTNIAVLGQEILFLLGIDPQNHSFYWALDGMASVKAWRQTLVPQAWSLSMEFYFYLIAPFILRRSVYWLSLLFILSLALRLFIISAGSEYDLLARRCFPAELCLFIIGSFSYFLLTKIKNCRNKYSLGLTSWAALLVVLTCFNKIEKEYALFVLGFTAFITIPFVFNLTKDIKVDRFLGNISYPIYIVHFLIIASLQEYLEEYSFSFLLILVLSLSTILYCLVDAPINRWRQRRVLGPIMQCKVISREVNVCHSL